MYREAQNFFMNELDRRASDAGQQVSSTAGHLRKIAEELRTDDLSRPAAQLADRGAQTLEDIGRYLAQSKGDKLLADAERFGRQRPWVLASAGVALGLAGSRMLKASAARRAHDHEDGGSHDSVSAGLPTYPSSSASSYKSSAASNYGTTGMPVSSDAAPGKAASQGASPSKSSAASNYGTTGMPVSSDAAPGKAASQGASPSTISKSSEVDRLMRGDGS